MAQVELGPEDAALVLRPDPDLPKRLRADVHLPVPPPGAHHVSGASSLIVALRLRLQHDEAFAGEMMLWLSAHAREHGD